MSSSSSSSASAWRVWSESAPLELLELFNGRSLQCLKDVRRNYPADCGPGNPMYLDLRRDSVEALNDLCKSLQEEEQ